MESKIDEIASKFTGDNIINVYEADKYYNNEYIYCAEEDIYSEEKKDKFIKKGIEYKKKFGKSMISIINLLKEAIKLAGPKHVYLNNYFSTIINAVIRHYNRFYMLQNISIKNAKDILDSENNSDT